ncbi:MAG TPA: hypothetical protein VIW69_19415 [Candidatus Elarobacter sp.]
MQRTQQICDRVQVRFARDGAELSNGSKVVIGKRRPLDRDRPARIARHAGGKERLHRNGRVEVDDEMDARRFRETSAAVRKRAVEKPYLAGAHVKDDVALGVECSIVRLQRNVKAREHPLQTGPIAVRTNEAAMARRKDAHERDVSSLKRLRNSLVDIRQQPAHLGFAGLRFSAVALPQRAQSPIADRVVTWVKLEREDGLNLAREAALVEADRSEAACPGPERRNRRGP